MSLAIRIEIQYIRRSHHEEGGEVQLTRVLFAVKQDVRMHSANLMCGRRHRRPAMSGGLLHLEQQRGGVAGGDASATGAYGPCRR